MKGQACDVSVAFGSARDRPGLCWGRGVSVPPCISYPLLCNNHPQLRDAKQPSLIVGSASCHLTWLSRMAPPGPLLQLLPSGCSLGLEGGMSGPRCHLLPRSSLQQGRLGSCRARPWFPISPPPTQGGPGQGHRGVHPLLRWLLCGHVRAGHRRPAQRQHHDPRERAGRGSGGLTCGQHPPSGPCPGLSGSFSVCALPFRPLSCSTLILATFWGISRPSLESTVSESHSSSPMTLSM